jgi:hypothetical protein
VVAVHAEVADVGGRPAEVDLDVPLTVDIHELAADLNGFSLNRQAEAATGAGRDANSDLGIRPREDGPGFRVVEVDAPRMGTEVLTRDRDDASRTGALRGNVRYFAATGRDWLWNECRQTAAQAHGRDVRVTGDSDGGTRFEITGDEFTTEWTTSAVFRG